LLLEALKPHRKGGGMKARVFLSIALILAIFLLPIVFSSAAETAPSIVVGKWEGTLILRAGIQMKHSVELAIDENSYLNGNFYLSGIPGVGASETRWKDKLLQKKEGTWEVKTPGGDMIIYNLKGNRLKTTLKSSGGNFRGTLKKTP
jgi:hypothetical protein